MPNGELVAGAALVLTLQVLRDAIKKAKERSLTTKCILDRLDGTVSKITPLVVQVDKLMSERVEDSPRKVIQDLKHLLEKAVAIVEAYAELRRRNLLKKYRYKRRIKELEASLRWMVDVDIQVNQWADIKELTANMSEMNTKLDKITSQPTDFNCFKNNPSISQSSNQNILEATGRSSEEDEESPSDGSEPMIDIHFDGVQENKTKIVRSHSSSSDV